ncbi:MAG: minor extracellular serine protease Vpr [Micromonosporaceae bacterium]
MPECPLPLVRRQLHRQMSIAVGLLLVVAVLPLAGSTAYGTPAGPSPGTSPTGRWIVQLAEPSLVTHARGTGKLDDNVDGQAKLDAAQPDSATYTAHLRDAQRGFGDRLRTAVPGAQVEQNYQVVFNGLAVKMSAANAERVRSMPGVRGVTPDIAYRADMFSTPGQIGAPALWNALGGQANAGSGVKVAIIDSGIFVRRAADGSFAGNPCFTDAGYHAPRGYPKGDTRFTNNKVIVARSFFRPDDPPVAGDDTPIQGPDDSPHGTHVAGTVACNANTPATFQGANVTLSGVAPHAFLMNYKVFYASRSTEDFQNGNAYTVELVAAIEQAVRDGADVISNSWSSTYQNTLAWPDPMVQAAENAVDAGVTMVFANSNAGPDEATTGSPANSPKVIGVGAVTKNTTIVPGAVDVTGPAPVPTTLTNLAVGPAAFGPQVTTTLGPAQYVPAEIVAANHSALGCSLAGDTSPFPAGSLTGKIALIERGTCNFSEKVFNAQRGGAAAAFVFNSVAGGDNLQGLTPGVHAGDVTIPSWFLRRSNGLAMRDFATAHPGQVQAKFSYAPQVAPNTGDVMAGFSSRGPTQDKLLKPDLVAPGVDVLSAGFAAGAFPANVTGFGSASGTSMATPHVAGAAALLIQLHPRWKPAQVKSALMNTADENVFLDTTQTTRAGVLDRGAGRIDLTKAGSPGLTLRPASVSGGEVPAGGTVPFTIRADDVGGAGTWDVSAVLAPNAAGNVSVSLGTTSLTVRPRHSTQLRLQVAAAANAAPANYEGVIRLTRRGGGARLHLPLWIRVVPGQINKQVLLVDDDGSSAGAGFADYSATYRGILDRLGVSYDYIDVWNDGFPNYNTLFGYRTVVVFSGDNNSFDTSGFGLADHDRLSQWLDSGGRLLAIGQNWAEAEDDNASFSSTRLGRARLYHGYLGLAEEQGSLYGGAPPAPTAAGEGPFAGQTVSLTGTENSVEATSPLGDTDTFNALSTMTRFFRPLSSTAQPTWGLSFGRSSEPSLGESRLQFNYRSAALGFGLEGVVGTATQDALMRGLLDWLVDRPAVSIGATVRGANTMTFTGSATSSAGSSFATFRWDFGDGSPVVTAGGPTVEHRYRKAGVYQVRVEATDSLGHRTTGTRKVVVPLH